VRVTDRSAPGTVFIPFVFYETAANRLTHAEKLDPEGKIPEYKVCAVKIESLAAGDDHAAEPEAAAPAP